MNTTHAQPIDARLSDFTVEVRPLASERKAKFVPVEAWWKNAKLRRAAESTLELGKGGKPTHTKYVEDGDQYFKVRRAA